MPRSTPPPIPTPLLTAAAGDRLVVLVGAGASLDAGLPGWTDLLNGLCNDAAPNVPPEKAPLLERARNDRDPRKRASALEHLLGPQVLRARVVERLALDDAAPTATHQALAMLPGTLFVTTNFDDLLERALRDGGHRPRIVLDDPAEVYAFTTGDVLKIHGDVHNPATLVLTQRDYDERLSARRAAWQKRFRTFLEAGHRLLLVGYGYGDEDVRRIVEEVRDSYPRELVRPYWLALDNVVTRFDADDAGLELIPLASWDDVPAWIRTLCSQARAAHPTFVVAQVCETTWAALQDQANDAEALFAEGEWHRAAEAYLRLRSHAAALLTVDTSGEARNRWAGATANAAGAYLNFGDAESASPLLTELTDVLLDDPGASSHGVRREIASAWAQLEDVDRARALVETLPLGERGDIPLLIAIRSGEVPSVSPTSDHLRGQLALMHSRAGRFAEASVLARTFPPLGIDPHLLVNPWVAGTHALIASALGSTLAVTTVGLEDRSELLAWSEVALATLRQAKLAEHARIAVNQLASDLYYATQDRPRWDAARANGGGSPPTGDMAIEPHPDLPWDAALREVFGHLAARRIDRAVAQASELTASYPHVSLVHLAAADAALLNGDAGAALNSSEESHRLLPGRGGILLRARAHLHLAQPDEAWKLLAPLLEDPPTDSRVVRYAAASRLDTDPTRAAELYARYLADHDNRADAVAWVHRTQALADSNHRADAVAIAAEALDALPDLADPNLIATLARVALLHASDGAVRVARRAYERLASLLPTDPEVALARLQLYFALGEPQDLPAPDMAASLAAGALIELPKPEGLKALREYRQRSEAAWNLWRGGLLPFDRFTDAVGVETTEALVRLEKFGAPDDGDVLLRPPHASLAFQSSQLRGAHLLFGDLELALLADLDLISELHARIGPDGRVLVFEDTWRDRLREAANRLRTRLSPVASQRAENLERYLTSTSRLQLIHADPGDDAATDAEAVLDIDNASTLAGWLRALVDAGEIASVDAAPALVHLPDVVPPDNLPSAVQLSDTALQRLWDHELLDRLVQRLSSGTIRVSPEALRRHRRRLSDHRIVIDASDRADRLRAALSAAREAGWLRLIPRPSSAIDAAFAPPRTQELTGPRELLIHVLSWQWALHEHPERLLVTADEATAVGSARTGLANVCAWPSVDSARNALTPLLDKAGRVVSLADLALQLAPESRRQSIAERLADLGFPGVFNGHALFTLARRHNGLRGRAARLLDRSEWHARQRRSFDEATKFRLGRDYAQAIWHAWCGDDVGDGIDLRAFSEHLLGRLSALESPGSASLLEDALEWLLLHAATNPRASFVRVQDEDATNPRMTPHEASPAGRMWTWLCSWRGDDARLSRAWHRALRSAVLDLHTRADIDEIRIGVLFTVLRSTQEIHPLALAEPGIRELTILQALAPTGERMFDAVQVGLNTPSTSGLLLDQGHVLVEAARRIMDDPPDIIAKGIHWLVELHLPDGSLERCEVPPEAVVLYADATHTNVVKVVRGWAMDLATADARLATAWSEFAEDPTNPAIRRALAFAGATSPSAEIACDPLAPLTWGKLGPTVRLSRLAELRAALAEPPEDVVDATSALQARTGDAGVWQAHPLGVIRYQAALIPGSISTALLMHRLEEHAFSEELRLALHRLAHPHDQPVAVLVADLLFVRCAAALRPEMRQDGNELPLAERVPELIADVLESVAGNAPPRSVAAVEGAWLRHCAAIVGVLAGRDNQDPLHPGLTATTHLWLTWRLYQWWQGQFANLSDGDRELALTRLGELPDTAHVDLASPAHLLDPQRFDVMLWDQRLAAVLWALQAAKQVVREVLAQQNLPDTAPDVVSDRLTTRLIELALRQCTPAEQIVRHLIGCPLGWTSPVAVPDLSLEALLRTNASAVSTLTPDQRRQILAELPASVPDAERRSETCITSFLDALADHAHALEPDELRSWMEILKFREEHGDTHATRSLVSGFGRLLATGRVKDESAKDGWDFLENRLRSTLAERGWAWTLGITLVAIAWARPGSFEASWQYWHDAVQPHQPPAALHALVQVLFEGTPESIATATRLVLDHVQQAPFSDDDMVRAIANQLRPSGA